MSSLLSVFTQGMPAADAGAGAGNLDFLRNSQQVSSHSSPF